MQDVTIPKAGSNANSATRILLFIIAVHYHTARPQGKPVRREAPDGLPAHTPQAVIETCRAGLLTRLRSEAFPAQRPVASVPERFASAGHPDRKEAETYSSGNCRRFARRSLIRLPDGPPVGIEPRHVRKDSEYIGTKYPQKQKQPGRRADSTETGKSAATSIRSGIPRAARVKDRRNRSAQRYSSMSVSYEPIRDRSGRRQAVAPLLTEAARRSINTTGFASGERKSARKKTDIFPQGNRLGIFPCTAASRHEQPANGGKRTKRLRFCIASYRTSFNGRKASPHR